MKTTPSEQQQQIIDKLYKNHWLYTHELRDLLKNIHIFNLNTQLTRMLKKGLVICRETDKNESLGRQRTGGHKHLQWKLR